MTDDGRSMNEDQPAGTSTTKIVLIIVLAVGLPVIGLVCCCGGIGIWGLKMLKEIPAAQASAEAFLRTLSENQIDAAYQSTTANFKSTTSLDGFRKFIAQYPELNSPFNFTLGNSTINTLPQGTRAVIRATITDRPRADDKRNPRSITCTITLAKENDVWKVEGFTVP